MIVLRNTFISIVSVEEEERSMQRRSVRSRSLGPLCNSPSSELMEERPAASQLLRLNHRFSEPSTPETKPLSPTESTDAFSDRADSSDTEPLLMCTPREPCGPAPGEAPTNDELRSLQLQLMRACSKRPEPLRFPLLASTASQGAACSNGGSQGAAGEGPGAGAPVGGLVLPGEQHHGGSMDPALWCAEQGRRATTRCSWLGSASPGRLGQADTLRLSQKASAPQPQQGWLQSMRWQENGTWHTEYIPAYEGQALRQRRGKRPDSVQAPPAGMPLCASLPAFALPSPVIMPR